MPAFPWSRQQCSAPKSGCRLSPREGDVGKVLGSSRTTRGAGGHRAGQAGPSELRRYLRQALTGDAMHLRCTWCARLRSHPSRASQSEGALKACDLTCCPAPALQKARQAMQGQPIRGASKASDLTCCPAPALQTAQQAIQGQPIRGGIEGMRSHMLPCSCPADGAAGHPGPAGQRGL